jgi:hypothetical protein
MEGKQKGKGQGQGQDDSLYLAVSKGQEVKDNLDNIMDILTSYYSPCCDCVPNPLPKALQEITPQRNVRSGIVAAVLNTIVKSISLANTIEQMKKFYHAIRNGNKEEENAAAENLGLTIVFSDLVNLGILLKNGWDFESSMHTHNKFFRSCEELIRKTIEQNSDGRSDYDSLPKQKQKDILFEFVSTSLGLNNASGVKLYEDEDEEKREKGAKKRVFVAEKIREMCDLYVEEKDNMFYHAPSVWITRVASFAAPVGSAINHIEVLVNHARSYLSEEEMVNFRLGLSYCVDTLSYLPIFTPFFRSTVAMNDACTEVVKRKEEFQTNGPLAINQAMNSYRSTDGTELAEVVVTTSTPQPSSQDVRAK